MTYDSDNFETRNATLRPDQRYPQLDNSQLGLFEDIESVKVNCNGQSQSATTQSATQAANDK